MKPNDTKSKYRAESDVSSDTAGRTQRKIIHCDCDCFYAAVEMRDNPELRTRSIAVGGAADKRGVVATCNYAARRFGVRSAMPMATALRLCPDLVVVSTNMSKYKAESARVQAIFADYTHLIEPLSLDEAFLDVTGTGHLAGSATRIAREIRDRVRRDIGITISAGIAPNKFLAKIASDENKPDGQLTITPQEVDAFVYQLSVRKLFGVGAVTAERMSSLNIQTCGDLQTLPLADLTRHFGKFGVRLYDLCRGRDNRAVRTDRVRKSISVERTFARDLPTPAACLEALEILIEDLNNRVTRADAALLIDQATIKVRFAGFDTTTAAAPAQTVARSQYLSLFDTAWQRGQRPVRLLGVGVRLGKRKPTGQLGLFDDISLHIADTRDTGDPGIDTPVDYSTDFSAEYSTDHSADYSTNLPPGNSPDISIDRETDTGDIRDSEEQD